MAVEKTNTGAIGRRRIVPMLGIDFIAGQIARKYKPNPRYGQKPASIGGRTRKWSTINFMQLQIKGRTAMYSAADLERQANFTIASQSATNTLKTLPVFQSVLTDFLTNKTRQGVPASAYATARGWCMAVRYAQILAGAEITPETTDWTW